MLVELVSAALLPLSVRVREARHLELVACILHVESRCSPDRAQPSAALYYISYSLVRWFYDVSLAHPPGLFPPGPPASPSSHWNVTPGASHGMCML